MSDSLKKYEEEKRSSIMIGGFGGITIPLDDDLKRAISSFIYQKVKDIIDEDSGLVKQIAMIMMRSKDYLKETLKPMIKEMIEDIDFTVRFEKDD